MERKRVGLNRRPLLRSRAYAPHMQQVATITIVAPSDHDDAHRLLHCLRENFRELRVEIAEPDGNHVLVTDHSGSVASLPDLLEERLDQCGQDLGISNRREHLLRRPPAAGHLRVARRKRGHRSCLEGKPPIRRLVRRGAPRSALGCCHAALPSAGQGQPLRPPLSRPPRLGEPLSS